MKQEVSIPDTIAFMAMVVIMAKFTHSIVNLFVAPYFSSLRNIPGPPSKHSYHGWTTAKVRTDLPNHIRQNHQKFGSTFYGVQTPFTSTLYTIDVDCVNYIFQNQYSSHFKKGKPELFRRLPVFSTAVSQTLGSTILGVEEDVHKRHRKALLPAFNDSSVRKASEIMFEVTKEFVKVIKETIQQSPKEEQGFTQIQDISILIKEASLDMIGLAGFGEDLGGLRKQSTKLFECFQGMVNMITVPSYYAIMRFKQPWIASVGKYFVREEKQLRYYKKGVRDCTERLLEKADEQRGQKTAVEDRTVLQLIKRRSPTNKENSLTEEELRSSIAILLLGGYETTATTISWAFYELICDQSRQQSLREELKSEKNQGWQTDLQILNKLPFLDAICSEILRLHPAFALIQRICMQNTILPLGTSIKAHDGSIIKQIPIKRGEGLTVSIECLNTSEELWGKDSKTFLPERWLKEGHPLFDPELSKTTEQARKLGGWNHIMTFGQGVRMCLGFRFALAEMKIILAHCVDQFEWNAALDKSTGKLFEIESRGQAFNKPAIKGQNPNQCVLPISVKEV